MQKFPSPKITSELPGWYATIYATLTAISYSILCVNVLHHVVEEKSSGMKNFYHSFFAWHNNVDSERHESITHKIQQILKLPIGISINNLCKDYENINAVNNVSFKIYKGQITGLLGHHGSGKSTIISILAGMAGASRGKVAILGHDVEFDLCQIRRSLGVCLQEDRLFTELSVIEHLTFFGIIKGLSKKSAYKEACSLLRRFKLTNKKPSLVSQLSNGMKRKLSICIAIIGNPKVLLLDEPTVGLDEESSRVVWNMLLSLRHSRVIVFSTQSMEEADILADQIAIFNQGNLVCYGTPSYLRTEYGPNGSGKTTFFRVVTGECLPTTGDAQISYENELIYLSSNLKKYCSMLGYCPQSNGLMNNLTGREMLYLFGKIRGIAGGIDNLVSLWMYMLDLEVFSNTLCKNYSKGDKRKLSIGIALIGSPSVVFLDEPVAGVDLETYTNVSNILNFALKQHNNICIILSTQNPSICESMCNQIGVLENGQLKYCNNITHFQNKYGKGFTVKLKLNISKKQFLSDIESSEIFDDFIATVSIVYKRACHKKVANLMNDVQFMYNELCLLKDRNDNLLHYHIQDETKKWSEVYKEIADLQCRHSIVENYEISDLSSDYYY
ncbi:hypothetical protein RN001_000031 [Aquatica leii]|uniref:ABC transporter domain-containing protein n=1 Tax=Aquatica leii TaxID=1421715 RepID=A0AAN7Q9B8_9COLE|nr:hypothetical protein RN001_000031 [Aquatica leii]